MSNSTKKGKGIASRSPSIKDKEDPFGASPPLQKTIVGELVCHYVPSLTKSQLPALVECLRRNNADNEHPSATLALHCFLYRTIFERNDHDRLQIPAMLRIGDTMACFTPCKEKAVGEESSQRHNLH